MHFIHMVKLWWPVWITIWYYNVKPSNIQQGDEEGEITSTRDGVYEQRREPCSHIAYSSKIQDKEDSKHCATNDF